VCFVLYPGIHKNVILQESKSFGFYIPEV